MRVDSKRDDVNRSGRLSNVLGKLKGKEVEEKMKGRKEVKKKM